MKSKGFLGRFALAVTMVMITGMINVSEAKASTLKTMDTTKIEKISGDVFSGGDGTELHPFTIATKSDLILLGELSSGLVETDLYSQEYINNAHYQQFNDIDMEYDYNFIPIGYSFSNGFSGVYDAKENTISNLMVDFDRTRATSIESVGIFCNTQKATLENIKLENPQITVLGQAHDYVGGIVGYAKNTTIKNCHVNGGFINAKTSNSIGVIAGYLVASTITDSGSTTTITGNNYVGGIFGQATGAIKVYDNYSKSTITGNSAVGGIGGYVVSVPTNTIISNCYSGGKVTGATNVGGILGFTNAGNVTFRVKNNYSYASLKANSNVGGIVGQVQQTGTSSSTVMVIEQNYTNNHIDVATSYAGGILGFGNRAYGYTQIDIKNNYIITNILAPTGTTNISIIGVGAGTYTNNHYSFDSTITGGTVASFANATITYKPEINLYSWWDNVLQINKDNAFDTKKLEEGYLPTLYKNGKDIEVRHQELQEYAGNHVPEAEDGVYLLGSNQDLKIPIKSYGSIVTGVQGLVENQDYYTDGTNVIFRSQFLETLEEGTSRFTVTFNSGYKLNINLLVREEIPKPPTFESTVADGITEWIDASFMISAPDINASGIDVEKTKIVNLDNGDILTNHNEFGFVRQKNPNWRELQIYWDYLIPLGDGEHKFRITFDNKSYKDVIVIIDMNARSVKIKSDN